MARVSVSEVLKRNKQRLEMSKKWRRDEGYDATWRRMIDMYRGLHYEDFRQEDRLLVNIAFATINIMAPSISVNHPKITVNSVRPENAANAVIAEAVVNYWWRHHNIRDQFRRAVKDSLIIGHGWIKVGYRFVEEERVNDNPDAEDVSEEGAVGGEGAPISVILQDGPFAERVSPMDVFVDPDATSLSDAKWIAQRIRRPIAEVRSDKRYSKVARDEIQTMAVSRYSDDPSKRKIRDKNIGYAEIWEFYDIAAKQMCVFAENCDHFLVKPMPLPYAFGQPYVMVRDYDIPDQFYPLGELESIEPLQRELNETRTQMMNHRKRYARKYLYKESAFDSMGRAALESDDDNVMVPVVSDEPLTSVVSPMPAVINPPEFYDQSQLIVSDIDRVSGVTEIQRGGSPEIRRTATEAALTQDAANARTADKLAIIEASISEIGRRMVQLAQQFMTGEQVARVVGADGEPVWVNFDRDYLEGDFDFQVEAGSTQPNNEQFRRQMALQMVDAMSPFAAAGVINMQQLAAHVLKEGFGVKNPEQFIAQPQPQPEMPQGPEGMGGPAGPPGMSSPEEVMLAQMMGGMQSGGSEAGPPPMPTAQ